MATERMLVVSPSMHNGRFSVQIYYKALNLDGRISFPCR